MNLFFLSVRYEEHLSCSIVCLHALTVSFLWGNLLEELITAHTRLLY